MAPLRRRLHGVDDDWKEGGDRNDGYFHQVVDAEEQNKRRMKRRRRDGAQKLNHRLEHAAQQRHKGESEPHDDADCRAGDKAKREPVERRSDHLRQLAGENSAGKRGEDDADRRPVRPPDQAGPGGGFPQQQKESDQQQSGPAIRHIPAHARSLARYQSRNCRSTASSSRLRR